MPHVTVPRLLRRRVAEHYDDLRGRPAAGGGGGGTPASTVVGEQTHGQAPVVGVSSSYARGDHSHGTPPDPIPAHTAAADPHPGYQTRAEKGAASGYASLGADGLVPQDQLGTGVQDGTRYLRDDGTWQAVGGGGAHKASHVVGGSDAFVAGDLLDATAKNIVRKAGVAVGTRRSLNLIEGAGIALTMADDAANEEVDVTIAASGGGLQHATKLYSPANFVAANLTTATAFVTNTTYFVYVGRVPIAITTLNVLARVATALSGAITWLEVGVFTGAPVGQGAASLTRRGFTNVAASWNTTGLKKTAVALTGVAVGDDLWLAFGGQVATTQMQMRAGLADDVQSGLYQQVTGRLSTLATPVATTLAAATLAVPWVYAEMP